MSLTNPNTPVSQQDLKDLYEQKILPYIGGAFGLVATGIDSANLYSTTERVIGQWIDGKPLYQKTLTGTAPASSDTQNIQIGANVESALVISGYCQHESFLTPINIQISSNEYFIAWIRDNSNPTVPNTVGLKVGSALYNGSYRIVIQYTKTTDSAVESYGTDTTYSTDEHVVGSWVDGSPLYQKSFKIVPANYGGSSSLVLPSSLTGLTNFLTISHEIWDIYSECYNTGVSSTRTSDNAILINGLNLNYPNIDHWITIRYTKLVSS